MKTDTVIIIHPQFVNGNTGRDMELIWSSIHIRML